MLSGLSGAADGTGQLDKRCGLGDLRCCDGLNPVEFSI